MTRRRKLAVAAAVIGACLAVLVTRAVWEGRSALADGDRAAAAGDIDQAIGKWRRAARWYVPLAPHVGSAYDRLENAGREAEAASDPVTALRAWRGVRSSILATRSFYTPHSDRLEPANQRIAALMASVEGPRADPGKTPEQRQAWHLELLQRPVGPSTFWSIVAIVGFLAWVGGAFWFAWGGLDPDDRLVTRVAARSGVLVVLGLLVWMFGLLQA
jgi:hypothetical protein